jgi:hypothetical protein
MSLRGVRLTEFPEPAREDEYEEAGFELEGFLAALPGAVAVYRFGNVGAPGISDLDRLVVVEDMPRIPEIWSRLTPRTRYLCMHTPFLADPPTFRRHRWFADLGTLRLAWGQDLTTEERPIPDVSEPRLAAEALTLSYIKLHKLAVSGRVKVRPLLCELNNVGRDLDLARLPRSKAVEARLLAGQVHALRQDWWRLSHSARIEGIRSLLDRAPAAMSSALTAIAEQHANGVTGRALSLRPPWAGVILAPGEQTTVEDSSSVAQLLSRFPKVGEARWRAGHRRIAIPPGISGLLSGDVPSERDFPDERAKLVARYVRVAGPHKSYSLLGYAEPFLQL